MSQRRNDKNFTTISRYLLIFSFGMILLSFSNTAYSQDSSHRRHPQPPPHPAIHEKLKAMVEKFKQINPFKKKDATEQASVKEEPKNTQQDAPPPLPPPMPNPVKTNSGTAHKTTSARKKTKSSKPATDSKTKVVPII